MLLLAAAIIGVIALRLRQPLVIGFIAVGILAGPAGLNVIRATDEVHVFAEMGLALLLFVVGLKLDLHIIRTLGTVALITGLAQVLITATAGMALALAFGFAPLSALYIALALTFSSTIIVVKLLTDKHETESLHGRLTLGILLVQDLVVVLAMLALSAFGGESTMHPLLLTLLLVLKAIGMLAAVWVITFHLLPRLLPVLARSTELLVLFGIAWALALALLGDQLGFGKEVGAFLAGVSLASTEYREIIAAKLVSLRDFLLLFFFVELGSRLDLGGLGSAWVAALVLAVFVLVGKPLVVMGVLAAMGYRKRTGFMSGISLAQVSEFSLILVAMALASGHIGEDTVGMVTLIGLITIAVSSYLVQDAQRLYEWAGPRLRFFDRRAAHREDVQVVQSMSSAPIDVILFGLGSYGTGIAEQLLARGRGVLGVDFDPQAVSAWQNRGWRAVFGDAEDPDFAATLPLAHARWVVSAIRDPQMNQAVAEAVRHAGYTGNLAFTARVRDEGEEVIARHAGLLFVPFEDAAVQAVDLLLLREDEIARETMDHVIDTMTDHYIVCGYGRMGQQIVKDLRRQHVPFVVIEDNPEQIPRLKEEKILHIVGKASNDEVLLHAGIMRAKGVIAVAASDEENVFIVLTARGLNTKLCIVARSIREENEDKLRRAGADRVMSPYILGGRRMAAAVTKPGVMDFLDLVVHSESMATEIGHVQLTPGSTCIGKSVLALGLWQACGATLLAVQRGHAQFHANPAPDFELTEGDDLIVMGTPEQIAAAQTYCAGSEE